jgi:hypothetical protein
MGIKEIPKIPTKIATIGCKKETTPQSSVTQKVKHQIRKKNLFT